MLEVIRLTATRIPKGGTHHARSAMARAWALRDSPTYVREDFEIMRAIAEAARFTPGLWLLNRVSELWIDAADELRMVLRPPDDYVVVHSKFFDLIEAGDADAAVALMSGLPGSPRQQALGGAAGARVTYAPYHHSPTARAVLRSLVPVICPPEALPLADAIIDHIALTLGAMPALLQRIVPTGLVAFDLGALPRFRGRARTLARRCGRALLRELGARHHADARAVRARDQPIDVARLLRASRR